MTRMTSNAKSDLLATNERNVGVSIFSSSARVPAITEALRRAPSLTIATSPTIPPALTVSYTVLPADDPHQPLLDDVERVTWVILTE
jgi:hypothetical protein